MAAEQSDRIDETVAPALAGKFATWAGTLSAHEQEVLWRVIQRAATAGDEMSGYWDWNREPDFFGGFQALTYSSIPGPSTSPRTGPAPRQR